MTDHDGRISCIQCGRMTFAYDDGRCYACTFGDEFVPHQGLG